MRLRTPSATSSRVVAGAALAALLVGLTACVARTFEYAGPDASDDDAAAVDSGSADAAADACVPLSAEVCGNGLDDDCNGAVDDIDITTDEQNCGDCVIECTNAFGTTECLNGTCTPACDPGAVDCDGDPIAGCELIDTNPMCADAVMGGMVAGDMGADVLSLSGSDEAWYRFRIDETVSVSATNLRAVVQLASPPGINFDLFVRCASCASPLILSSSNPSGMADIVPIGRTDIAGDTTFEIFVEIRYADATACADWFLTVSGNTGTFSPSCD